MTNTYHKRIKKRNFLIKDKNFLSHHRRRRHKTKKFLIASSSYSFSKWVRDTHHIFLHSGEKWMTSISPSSFNRFSLLSSCVCVKWFNVGHEKCVKRTYVHNLLKQLTNISSYCHARNVHTFMYVQNKTFQYLKLV